jgi:hypothetical protein
MLDYEKVISSAKNEERFMKGATRPGAIALATCLTCQIVTAQVASPDSQSISAKGIVQVSKVSMDSGTLELSGATRCATATVQVAVIGLGVKPLPDPTVTISLVGSRTMPPGVSVDITGIKDSQQVTSSPGIFTFLVCATGLPSGTTGGAVTVQADVLKVSPESGWRVGNPELSACTVTFAVNDPKRSSAKPELKLIVIPVSLQIAKQNGDAEFEFDVAASKGYPGIVVGSITISQPKNPDSVELVEGTNGGTLSFTLGEGQKLSDAHHLKYRIRTSPSNPHEGVLSYGLTLNANGDQITLQDATQQITVQVGDAARK